MFPVSVCLGIEKRDASPKIKRSASPSNSTDRADSSFGELAIWPSRNQDGRAISMNERYIKWYTPWLNREFEMLVFGNGGGLPLILFPTSFGRYYQNKDFGLVGSMSGYVEAGKVTVYCPDAIDLESFYNKSIHPADRMRTHNAYRSEERRVGKLFSWRECVLRR